MAYHSLRQDGDEWTWKFSTEVFRRSNKPNEWLTMGERLVQAPGRKAIVHGGMSQLFTPESAEYVRELGRSEEHTSELQSLMRISYAVFCLKKKKQKLTISIDIQNHQLRHTETTIQLHYIIHRALTNRNTVR